MALVKFALQGRFAVDTLALPKTICTGGITVLTLTMIFLFLYVWDRVRNYIDADIDCYLGMKSGV